MFSWNLLRLIILPSHDMQVMTSRRREQETWQKRSILLERSSNLIPFCSKCHDAHLCIYSLHQYSLRDDRWPYPIDWKKQSVPTALKASQAGNWGLQLAYVCSGGEESERDSAGGVGVFIFIRIGVVITKSLSNKEGFCCILETF